MRESGNEEANGWRAGNEQSEAQRRSLRNGLWNSIPELKCDRKGKEMCDFGKCWKEVDLDTGEITHHPVNPRDSSLLATYSGT